MIQDLVIQDHRNFIFLSFKYLIFHHFLNLLFWINTAQNNVIKYIIVKHMPSDLIASQPIPLCVHFSILLTMRHIFCMISRYNLITYQYNINISSHSNSEKKILPGTPIVSVFATLLLIPTEKLQNLDKLWQILAVSFLLGQIFISKILLGQINCERKVKLTVGQIVANIYK